MEKMTIELACDIRDMQNVFGANDTYVKKLEHDLDVMILDRNGVIKITGTEENAKKAEGILSPPRLPFRHIGTLL